MKFEELEMLVKSAKAPRTRFTIEFSPFRDTIILGIHMRTRDIITKKWDWIHLTKMFSAPTSEDWFNESFWNDQIRRLARKLMEHEIDEHLEIGGTRPFYPHGDWKNRNVKNYS